MHRKIPFVALLAATATGALALASGGPAGDLPKPVRSIEQNNPAFRPFQADVQAKSGLCGEVAVPAGMRLVLEHASAIVEEGTGFYAITTIAGGDKVRHYLPLPSGGGTVVDSRQIRLYADPETPVEVCSAGLAVIALSGHLVPLS